MHKLIVTLPVNRDFEGRLRLEDHNGRLVAGPFAVCGRADGEAARRHGNSSRQALLPFGDTPLGQYQMMGILPTGSKTNLLAERFGPYGVVVLKPTAGEAALADANGRFHIVIQGGKLGRGRRLRPTSGSLRLADKDQRNLVHALRRSRRCLCEFVAAKGSDAGRSVAQSAGYEQADPPLGDGAFSLLTASVTSDAVGGGRFLRESGQPRQFGPPSFHLSADSGGGGGGVGGGYSGDDNVGADLRDAVADQPTQSSGTASGAASGDESGDGNLKWSGEWQGEDKNVVQDVINRIPDADNNPNLSQSFKQWVSANVAFTRGSMGATAPWLGVTPGTLKVEDSFLDAGNNPTAQTNVLTFELGKTLWHQVNGSDTKVAQTQAGRDFQNLLDQYPGAMGQMKFAPPLSNDTGDLQNLADLSDMQSKFGYAVRVAVGNLSPPATASAVVKRDWPRAVQAMQQYLVNNLPHGGKK